MTWILCKILQNPESSSCSPHYQRHHPSLNKSIRATLHKTLEEAGLLLPLLPKVCESLCTNAKILLSRKFFYAPRFPCLISRGSFSQHKQCSRIPHELGAKIVMLVFLDLLFRWEIGTVRLTLPDFLEDHQRQNRTAEPIYWQTE